MDTPNTESHSAITDNPVRSLINNKGVFNLSSHVLTDSEHSVLSRGLNFCPTPTSWDFSDVMDGLDCLHRRMRLAQFFEENSEPSDLKS